MEKRTSSLPFAAALTMIGGYLDAYSYAVRGKVFANAQTGNIVLFARAVAERNPASMLHYFIPILTFVVGVYLAKTMDHRYAETSRHTHLVLAIEAALAFVCAFVPHTSDNLANLMLSFLCAIQVATFGEFRAIPITTTMCTGNLKNATDFLHRYHAKGEAESKKPALVIYAFVALFALGATVGFLLSSVFEIRAVLLPAMVLLVLAMTA